MGVPNDVGFQKDVLVTLLNLLERTDGPVILDDYPIDAPKADDDGVVLSCPVRFDVDTPEDADPKKVKLLREIQAMRPWYDMALEKRGRTTVGGSGLAIDDIGDFLCDYIKGERPENPRKEVEHTVSLKLAVEDLKGFYIEGITAQPGQENLSSNTLKEWFWEKTIAGEMVFELIKVCSQSEEMGLKMTARFLAPFDMVMKRGDIKFEQ